VGISKVGMVGEWCGGWWMGENGRGRGLVGRKRRGLVRGNSEEWGYREEGGVGVREGGG